MGGGVVAEFFSDLRKPSRFCGGGVVAEIFSDLQTASRFSGGGVVAEFFRDHQTPARFSGGGSAIHFSLLGPFYIFEILKRGPPFVFFVIFGI